MFVQKLESSFLFTVLICFCSLTQGNQPSSDLKTQNVISVEKTKVDQTDTEDSIAAKCELGLKNFKSYNPRVHLSKACALAETKKSCVSVNGTPIFHIDTKGTAKKSKKILVISLIHGDETGAGTLSRFWTERLATISPRNDWRIIPVLNPDGVEKKTRTNARGIDLNRNFPTFDWKTQAHSYWQKEGRNSARKFPGETAASEPEVNCALDHIKEYGPDFVVSIHTPLNVLDFDGPKKAAINGYKYLPWRRLGNFPGSLGRYLWVENQIPVLTAELKTSLPLTSEPLVQLQDLIGYLTQKDLE